MTKIHFLPVKHGDAFIIECEHGDKHAIIVVDGGPPECGHVLINKLYLLGLPDLLVLTHYDNDHIGGILKWVTSCLDKNTIPAKEVWANCACNVRVKSSSETSAKDGALLSTILNDFVKQGLSWKNDICEGYKVNLQFAEIEVISPTKEMLGLVIEKQEDESNLLALTKANKRTNADLEISLDDLAQQLPKKPDPAKDNDLANAASIAFLFRSPKISILMLGDCYPQNVEHYLKCQGYSEAKPLVVDYIKVSHHGSRNNVSNDLLDIIKCHNYIISTNGGKGMANHPDRTALAHILCHPKRDRSEKVHLYFNYSIPIVEKNGAAFLKPDEPELYNFEIHENVNEICI